VRTVTTEDFDLDGVPKADREGRWEEVLSSTHVDLAVRLSADRPARPFRATVRRLWIDDLALVDVTCDPCSGVRGATRIKRADIDYVVVLINRAGRESVCQDDAATQMHPGDAVVWDSTRPGGFRVWEPMAKRSLFVPRSALGETGTRGLGVAGGMLDGGAPATELLTSYLDILARTVSRLSPAAVSAVRNATLDLVSAALQPGQTAAFPGPGVPVLRAVIGQWIEQNLDRVDLSPSAIAIAHNMSLRSVHRLFEETGETVSSFIRIRRLAQARMDLAATDDAITEIAARWRFYDASHFTRAFRAQYGLAPSHYRADPAARTAAG
jgi:AraC family transcriptional activator of tynA and feaB